MRAAPRMETNRLILRNFTPDDIPALDLLLRDETVNQFLPWFPTRNPEEAAAFYEQRIRPQPYFLAVCLRAEDIPIGYVAADTGESHDFGYALRRVFWHRGLASEAAGALIRRLRDDRVPYITATHDRNNPRSGRVMQRVGMKYCYSYQEQWQPKNLPVIFRMYQLNLDGREDRVYRGYWERSDIRFVESAL